MYGIAPERNEHDQGIDADRRAVVVQEKLRGDIGPPPLLNVLDIGFIKRIGIEVGMKTDTHFNQIAGLIRQCIIKDLCIVHGGYAIAAEIGRIVHKINPVIGKATQAFDDEYPEDEFQ